MLPRTHANPTCDSCLCYGAKFAIFLRATQPCLQRQAAAVRMFLSFFRLSVLAFEAGEGHVQGLS